MPPWTEAAHALRTHVGFRRDQNEDAGLGSDRHGAWAVADGVGGAPAGEEASRVAVNAAVASLQAPSPGSLPARLLTATDAAQRAVLAAAVGPRRGMMTTLVLAGLVQGQWGVAHVGDSRAYRISALGRFARLTEDHGIPGTNAVTRVVGNRGDEPDVALFQAEPGDRLLLCTDGLTRAVSERAIAELLRAHPGRGRLGPCADALVSAALHAGGPDNVTVLLIGR